MIFYRGFLELFLFGLEFFVLWTFRVVIGGSRL